MHLHGIELLPDNIAECRANLLEIFAGYLDLKETDDLYRAAFDVLSLNLVHGDAMTMRDNDGQAICFAEWGPLGKGKYQRRDFSLKFLTRMSSLRKIDGKADQSGRQQAEMFAEVASHEVFQPTGSYPLMTLGDIAAAAKEVTVFIDGYSCALIRWRRFPSSRQLPAR